jgi:hypothetical protein
MMHGQKNIKLLLHRFYIEDTLNLMHVTLNSAPSQCQQLQITNNISHTQYVGTFVSSCHISAHVRVTAIKPKVLVPF